MIVRVAEARLRKGKGQSSESHKRDRLRSLSTASLCPSDALT